MARQMLIFLLAGLLFPFAGLNRAAADEEAGDLPVVLNPVVEAYMEYFTSDGKAGLQTWFNNSADYLPVIKEIFRNEKLPEELAYVAMIESGFDPRAVSRANAIGLWQLMPDTARQYRLRGDRWIDERRDLIKSTRAAARHFRFLRARLGSWSLVLAAYNAGLTTVRTAIRETGSEYFWELRESGRLARETSDFVPKIMAVVLISRDPAVFGFRVPPPRPVLFDTVSVPAATDLRMLAGIIGTTYATISSLNPEINGPFTPAHGYLLKIPKGKKQEYQSAPGRLELTMAAFAGTAVANAAFPASGRLKKPSAYLVMINNSEKRAEKLLLIALNPRRKTAARKPFGTLRASSRRASQQA